FSREAEARSCRGNPSRDSAGGRHTPKRCVQLHSVKLSSIKLQKALGGQAVRKESRFPCRVRPSRGADVQRHEGKDISAERHQKDREIRSSDHRAIGLLSEIPKRSEGSLPAR